jgi:DNA-binding MltR family transcriptional regulator
MTSVPKCWTEAPDGPFRSLKAVLAGARSTLTLFAKTMDDIDLSQFDGFPKHFQEVMEFRFSLNSETDRGCALMVASFLEHKLGRLLEAILVDDSKVVSELFSHSVPLGTFSSRIDIAYAMGLIGPATRRDINLIRKIRNEFGHSHQTLKFTDDRIRNRCKELFHVINIELTDEPRKMFVKTAMCILALINSDLRRTEHRAVGKDLYLDATERKEHQERIQMLGTSLDAGTNESLEQLLQFLNNPDQDDE